MLLKEFTPRPSATLVERALFSGWIPRRGLARVAAMAVLHFGPWAAAACLKLSTRVLEVGQGAGNPEAATV